MQNNHKPHPTQQTASLPILIIGAGIGGLSAAIRLAAAGLPVTIYEKNAAVGGKMSQYTAAGFRWDTGPSVITMRHVFEELFTAAGRNLTDYLTLLPVDPLTRYFYRDGTILDINRNLAQTLEHIATLEPRDVEGYRRYLEYAAEIHRITGPVFIYDKPPTPASFLRVPFRDWFKVDSLRKMDSAIKSFVRSPHLRQLLGRFATYVGASPYLAPATLNVIAHVELSGGVWYPQGGIYTIAAALRTLAEELGVTIYTDCQVQEIRVNGRAAGLIVDDAFIPARAVISNVDVATTYERLLPATPTLTKRLRQLQAAEPSCSGFVMLLGLKGNYPQLAHHNIFFTPDYPAEFDAIFKRGVMPSDPTIYLTATSKTDLSHAPTGHENWFILVNAPPLGPQWDWAQQAASYRNHILDKLASWGYDIRASIVYEKILTPVDLQEMSGAYRGALYGPSSNAMLAAFKRPPNRSATVPGLYFTGGTTHPGGGVPLVILSGKVAAQMVLQDLG